MNESNNTLSRILSHDTVKEVLITNREFKLLNTCKTLNENSGSLWSEFLHNITIRAKSLVREIDPQNDLEFMRIQCSPHEILVVPDNDFMIVVVQDPQASSSTPDEPSVNNQ